MEESAPRRLASSTNKKVVLHRFDRAILTGFVNPRSYLQAEGVELLSSEGVLATIPYEEIKTVRFVRDFDDDPEPQRRTFTSRPKRSGLWTRFKFRDGELLDSILPNNLVDFHAHGFQIYPPDSSAAQRWFIPKEALREVNVLAVIGSPMKRPASPRGSRNLKAQLELFG